MVEYILFIHSSVNGHLCCFHFLAAVNKAAITFMHKVFYGLKFSILLGIIARPSVCVDLGF